MTEPKTTQIDLRDLIAMTALCQMTQSFGLVFRDPVTGDLKVEHDAIDASMLVVYQLADAVVASKQKTLTRLECNHVQFDHPTELGSPSFDSVCSDCGMVFDGWSWRIARRR